jgi:outer membrane protein
MKNFFVFAAIAVLSVVSVNAQVEKGNWWFGADAGLSLNSTSNTPEVNLDGNDFETKITFTEISFTPSANYFVIDNLSIGLDFSIASTKTKAEFDDAEDESTTTSLGIIPNATYFFGDSNFKPFLSAGVGYLYSGGEDDITKFSGLALKGQGGLAYFVNNSVSVNFSVEYINANLKNKEDDNFELKTNTFALGLGFAIFI